MKRSIKVIMCRLSIISNDYNNNSYYQKKRKKKDALVAIKNQEMFK